jgi:hypothetical protein
LLIDSSVCSRLTPTSQRKHDSDSETDKAEKTPKKDKKKKKDGEASLRTLGFALRPPVLF